MHEIIEMVDFVVTTIQLCVQNVKFCTKHFLLFNNNAFLTFFLNFKTFLLTKKLANSYSYNYTYMQLNKPFTLRLNKIGLIAVELPSSRALRRADHAAAAGFSNTPPPPKFATGAPNAAAADNLWSSPAWVGAGCVFAVCRMSVSTCQVKLTVIRHLSVFVAQASSFFVLFLLDEHCQLLIWRDWSDAVYDVNRYWQDNWLQHYHYMWTAYWIKIYSYTTKCQSWGAATPKE